MEEQYNAIKTFVFALKDTFKRNKQLALYHRLLEKRTNPDEDFMNKHISLFKKFLTTYKDYIEGDLSVLPGNAKITYSDNVFINMSLFIAKSDKETIDVIQQHLLTILALIDPNDMKALDILETDLNKLGIDTSSKEGEFIGNIFNKVQNSAQNMNDPMSLISEITNPNGVFGQLLGGLQNGEMDLSKMLGTMQGLLGNLSEMKSTHEIKEEN